MVNGPYIMPPEFYARANDAIITAVRKTSIARDLVSVRANLGGIGVQNWSWSTQGTMSEAMVSWNFNQTSEDQISLSRASTRIPVLHKEFKLDFRDLAAADLNNYPLTTKNISEAAYKVAYLENTVMLDGYNPKGTGPTAPDDYEVKGLFQSAGNKVSEAHDFATYGNALNVVKDAKELFLADEIYGPFNMVINDIQYMELELSEHASYPLPEMPRVEKLLGGRIISSPFIPAGTGIIIPQKDALMAEMLITQDVSMYTEVESKSRDLWGQIYECFTPVIYQPNSICKLENI